MTIKNLDGRVQGDRFDSTDVTNVLVTWKSTGSAFINVLRDGYITDITLNIATAGTTLELKLFLNQQDTGIRWLQSQCFPALPTHFPNLNPIPVKAGDFLQLLAI